MMAEDSAVMADDGFRPLPTVPSDESLEPQHLLRLRAASGATDDADDDGAAANDDDGADPGRPRKKDLAERPRQYKVDMWKVSQHVYHREERRSLCLNLVFYILFLGTSLMPLVGNLIDPSVLLKHQEAVTDTIFSADQFAKYSQVDNSGVTGNGLTDVWAWAEGTLLDALIPANAPGPLGPNVPIGALRIRQARVPSAALRRADPGMCDDLLHKSMGVDHAACTSSWQPSHSSFKDLADFFTINATAANGSDLDLSPWRFMGGEELFRKELRDSPLMVDDWSGVNYGYGRAGLYVDMPTTDREAFRRTLAELKPLVDRETRALSFEFSVYNGERVREPQPAEVDPFRPRLSEVSNMVVIVQVSFFIESTGHIEMHHRITAVPLIQIAPWSRWLNRLEPSTGGPGGPGGPAKTGLYVGSYSPAVQAFVDGYEAAGCVAAHGASDLFTVETLGCVAEGVWAVLVVYSVVPFMCIPLLYVLRTERDEWIETGTRYLMKYANWMDIVTLISLAYLVMGWQAITDEWQHLTLCGLPNCPCSSPDPADCEMGCPADFCEPSHVWEDGTIPIAMQNASFVEMMPLRSCWNNLLWWYSVFCFVSILKVFKYVRLSPGMSLLWRTLSNASGPILSFGASLLILLGAFSLCTTFAFGYDVRGFHNLFESLNTLFRAGILGSGDYDYGELKDAEPQLAPLFLYLFIFLVGLIGVNTFVAILTVGFEKATCQINRWNDDRNQIRAESCGDEQKMFCEPVEYSLTSLWTDTFMHKHSWAVQPEIESVKGRAQGEEIAPWTVREGDTVYVRFRKWSSSHDPHLRESEAPSPRRMRRHVSQDAVASGFPRNVYLTVTTSLQTLADVHHARTLVRRLKERKHDADRLLRAGLAETTGGDDGYSLEPAATTAAATRGESEEEQMVVEDEGSQGRGSGCDRVGLGPLAPIRFHLFESPGDRENYATLEFIDAVIERDIPPDDDPDDDADPDLTHRFGEWLVFKVTDIESWQESVRTSVESRSYAKLPLTISARCRQTSEISRCQHDIRRTRPDDLDVDTGTGLPHLIIPHERCEMEMTMAPGTRPRLFCHKLRNVKDLCNRVLRALGCKNYWSCCAKRTEESLWRDDVLTYLRWRAIRVRYSSPDGSDTKDAPVLPNADSRGALSISPRQKWLGASRSEHQQEEVHQVTQMKQHNEADIWLNELPYRVKHHMQSSDRLFGFIPLGKYGQSNRKSRWRMLVVTAVCFLLWIYDVGDMWHCMVLAIFGNEIVQRSHRPRFETVSKNRATTRRLGCAGWRIVWCPAPKDLDKLLAPDDIAAIFTDPELELRDFVYWVDRPGFEGENDGDSDSGNGNDDGAVGGGDISLEVTQSSAEVRTSSASTPFAAKGNRSMRVSSSGGGSRGLGKLARPSAR